MSYLQWYKSRGTHAYMHTTFHRTQKTHKQHLTYTAGHKRLSKNKKGGRQHTIYCYNRTPYVHVYTYVLWNHHVCWVVEWWWLEINWKRLDTNYLLHQYWIYMALATHTYIISWCCVYVCTHTDRWSVIYLMMERQLIDRENWNDLWWPLSSLKKEECHVHVYTTTQIKPLLARKKCPLIVSPSLVCHNTMYMCELVLTLIKSALGCLVSSSLFSSSLSPSPSTFPSPSLSPSLMRPVRDLWQ